MNWIALMQLLSLIKHLKIHLQATSVSPIVRVYFLNTDLIWLVTYSYSVVLIKNVID